MRNEQTEQSDLVCGTDIIILLFFTKKKRQKL